MEYTQNDLDLFCLCVWKEARSEGPVGMDAVGHVIYNRVGFPGFAKTIHDVILGRNQFTSMSVPSDPEFNLAPKFGDAQYSYIKQIGPTILCGTDPDTTRGAHYYANLAVSTSGWFFDHIVKDPVNHPHTVKIGKQDFYV